MATLAILLLSRSMMPFMISALDVRRALFLVRLSWYRSVSSTISSPMISLKVRKVRMRKKESVIRVGEETRVRHQAVVGGLRRGRGDALDDVLQGNDSQRTALRSRRLAQEQQVSPSSLEVVERLEQRAVKLMKQQISESVTTLVKATWRHGRRWRTLRAWPLAR